MPCEKQAEQSQEIDVSTPENNSWETSHSQSLGSAGSHARKEGSGSLMNLGDPERCWAWRPVPTCTGVVSWRVVQGVTVRFVHSPVPPPLASNPYNSPLTPQKRLVAPISWSLGVKVEDGKLQRRRVQAKPFHSEFPPPA